MPIKVPTPRPSGPVEIWVCGFFRPDLFPFQGMVPPIIWTPKGAVRTGKCVPFSTRMSSGHVVPGTSENSIPDRCFRGASTAQHSGKPLQAESVFLLSYGHQRAPARTD